MLYSDFKLSKILLQITFVYKPIKIPSIFVSKTVFVFIQIITDHNSKEIELSTVNICACFDIKQYTSINVKAKHHLLTDNLQFMQNYTDLSHTNYHKYSS